MQLKDFTISNLFDLNETIAAELFEGKTYPWEVLGDISDFIIALGNKLPQDRFEKRGENIWVAKSATVFDSAYIGGPCIIDENATVRQCAFIRGSAIVGNGTTVGNSTELKNVVLFNKVEVPHYNYVGDSVLGFHAHMGAGSITSNVKADKKNVVIHCGEENMDFARSAQCSATGRISDATAFSIPAPSSAGTPISIPFPWSEAVSPLITFTKTKITSWRRSPTKIRSVMT